MIPTEPWFCRTCGGFHEELPLSFNAPAPEAYYEIPREEREARAVLSNTHAVLDGARHFLRASLELPVVDLMQPFTWGVWAEVGAELFRLAHDPAHTGGHASAPRGEGTLASALPGYPPTLGLPVWIQPRPLGQFPLLGVRDEAHPLRLEQDAGITLERVQEWASAMQHPSA